MASILLRVSLFVVLFSASQLFGQSSATQNDDVVMADAVLQEINLLRANPKAYASYLEEWRSKYEGQVLRMNRSTAFMTQEGIAPLEEAIAILKQTDQLPALEPTAGMRLAALDHPYLNNHPDAPLTQENITERADSYGRWATAISENVAFYHGSAREIVIQMLISDGIELRVHRNNLLNPEFEFTGVAYQKNDTFGRVLIITLAAFYKDNDKKIERALSGS